MASNFMRLGLSFFEQIQKQNKSVFSKGKKVVSQYYSLEGNPSFGKALTFNQAKGIIFALSFFFLLLFLLGRLFWLQVIKGKENRVLSDENRVFSQAFPSLRGVIYDRDGKILARNAPGFRVVIDPSLVDSRNGKMAETSKILLPILSLSQKDLEQKIKQALDSREVITLKNNISYDEQLKLISLANDIPGVKVQSEMVREYSYKEPLAHVLGFLGEVSLEEVNSTTSDYRFGSLIGREGLEKVYETYLKGKDGRSYFQADALGQEVTELKKEEPQNGGSLYLSLDLGLQLRAFEILKKAAEKYQANAAVFIAEEPSTGRILSLISLPSFDNNIFSQANSSAEISKILESQTRPLFNRAIAGLYPPGSVVKPLIGLEALETKLITKTTKIDDWPQVIEIGPFKFPDWTVAWGKGAHGLLDIKHAIAQSCDIFFYKIGGGFESTKGLGIEKIKDILISFGLGKVTGIDLPGEALGLVPDPLWKKEVKNEEWYLGDTYQLSIGQSFLLATPLQIVNYMSALANGGKLYKPILAEKVLDENGKVLKEFKPEIKENFLAGSANLQTIREGMRLAVSEGIVYPLRSAKVPVAAKTGTAEFGVPNAKGVFETHAWVAGFAPFDNPKISFVVLLEAGGASSNAAEVANEILNWYFSR